MINQNMASKSSFNTNKFEDLFRRWNRKVYHFALSKTNSTYIAEETVQRVFIKLWHNLNHKKININLEAQLFTISRSVLLDIIKEETRRRNAMHKIEPVLFDIHNTDLLEYKELENQLETLISRMPNIRQTVFRMSRMEQLNYQEIADQLSISKRTVENHIALALKTIRKSFSNFMIIFLLLIFH